MQSRAQSTANGFYGGGGGNDTMSTTRGGGGGGRGGGATAAADLSSSFGIWVAIRVRPFNRKEIMESNSSSNKGGKNSNNNNNQNHQIGSHHNSRNVSRNATYNANGDDEIMMAVTADSAHHKMPTPTVEVEADQKTVTLLDALNNYQERATFSFDFVYSPFSPSIDLGLTQSQNIGGPGGMMTRKGGAGGGPGGGAREVWSTDDINEVDAERAQAQIYHDLGAPFVSSAWQGYNGCIFAYGQTSSGKTYTMMGTKRDPGVIPRLCRDLFAKIEEEQRLIEMQNKIAQMDDPPQNDDDVDNGDGGEPKKRKASTTTTAPPVVNQKMNKVSLYYMEIYNEKVKDLLRTVHAEKPQFASRFASVAANEDFQSLRVRQHPLHGPFVEGLTKVDVNNWLECVQYIRQGNEHRSTTSTSMNEASSRSHAIFQLVLTQTEALGAKIRGKEVTNHKVSKINLVDLAGSERITRTNVTGKHLAEANYINQSLSTLRKVIDVLVSRKKPGQVVVVPYRESLLTWILADNFGGNSKTAMIANVSPHHLNASESEGTLRYATLAKGIVNRIRVNENPSAKLIRELQAQLRRLQDEVANRGLNGTIGGGPNPLGGERVRELEDQMEENKRAMEELLAREEGMRQLVHESRQREENLRLQKAELESQSDKWKEEAEVLRREKEALHSQLAAVSRQGTAVPLSEQQQQQQQGSSSTRSRRITGLVGGGSPSSSTTSPSYSPGGRGGGGRGGSTVPTRRPSADQEGLIHASKVVPASFWGSPTGGSTPTAKDNDNGGRKEKNKNTTKENEENNEQPWIDADADENNDNNMKAMGAADASSSSSSSTSPPLHGRRSGTPGTGTGGSTAGSQSASNSFLFTKSSSNASTLVSSSISNNSKPPVSKTPNPSSSTTSSAVATEKTAAGSAIPPNTKHNSSSRRPIMATARPPPILRATSNTRGNQKPLTAQQVHSPAKGPPPAMPRGGSRPTAAAAKKNNIRSQSSSKNSSPTTPANKKAVSGKEPTTDSSAAAGPRQRGIPPWRRQQQQKK